MSNLPGRKPRVKSQLHVHCVTWPAANMPGVLHLRQGQAEETSYFLYPEPSDFGKAFRLVKVWGGTEPYFVLLSGQQSSCECLGFLRWGKCKHLEALAQLVEGGAL